MAGYSYLRERRKLFRSLADQFHDKALASISPNTAAQWAFLADSCLWIASDDGEADVLKEQAQIGKFQGSPHA